MAGRLTDGCCKYQERPVSRQDVPDCVTFQQESPCPQPDLDILELGTVDVIYVPDGESRCESDHTAQHGPLDLGFGRVIWGNALQEDDIARDGGEEDDGKCDLVIHRIGHVHANDAGQFCVNGKADEGRSGKRSCMWTLEE